MGCALSSVPQRHPTLAKLKNQGRPKEAENGSAATFTQDFHPFPRLPYELRRQIWIECLSQETPRVYALELDIDLTREEDDTDWQPSDVKFAPARPLAGRDELRDLIVATATSRAIGSTCREARDATAFVLPDVLEMKANPKRWPGTSQRPHILGGRFRFNAKRDVIGVVFSSIRQLKYIRTWTQRGNLLPCAQIIQHVALDTSVTEDTRISMLWTNCGCGKPNCGVCSRDPVLDFLRLFPNLKSFNILQHSPWFLAETVGYAPEDVPPVSQCECDSDGKGIKHDWPLFKGMAEDAWFISYTEDGGCSYPTLPRLAYDRRPHGSRWPYYDALRELDIRILRRVTLRVT